MRLYRFLPEHAATQDTLQVVRGLRARDFGCLSVSLWVPISPHGKGGGRESLAGDLTCWLQRGLGEGGRR
jgi:hypothetical protein